MSAITRLQNTDTESVTSNRKMQRSSPFGPNVLIDSDNGKQYRPIRSPDRDFSAFKYRRKRWTYKIVKFFKEITRKRNPKYEDEPVISSNIPVVIGLIMLFFLIFIWLWTHESRNPYRNSNHSKLRDSHFLNSGQLKNASERKLKFKGDQFEADEETYDGVEDFEIPF